MSQSASYVDLGTPGPGHSLESEDLSQESMAKMSADQARLPPLQIYIMPLMGARAWGGGPPWYTLEHI